jgi:hypothetical protein
LALATFQLIKIVEHKYSGKKIMYMGNYSVSIPANETAALSQDREYVIVENTESHMKVKVRLHEYGKLYSIPGLYEHVYFDLLKCRSPQKVCDLLKNVIEGDSFGLKNLCVLDLGAGNGMVGEQLRKIGVDRVYGIDIEKNARQAAERDRPGVYEKYYVADLTAMSTFFRKKLYTLPFNCMTSVATLGFDDIPPSVFATVVNLVSNPGYIAFNIKEDFLLDGEPSGFSALIFKMIDAHVVEICHQETYRHRLSIVGKPLYYTAIIARKKSHIPLDWVQ